MGGQLVPGPGAAEQETSRDGAYRDDSTGMQKGPERKGQAAKWLGVGKTPVVVVVVVGGVGAVKGFSPLGDFQREVRDSKQLPAARATPHPRQRKKPGSEFPLPRPPASWAGQREAGRTGCRPAPRACPSCVVQLLRLPWR